MSSINQARSLPSHTNFMEGQSGLTETTFSFHDKINQRSFSARVAEGTTRLAERAVIVHNLDRGLLSETEKTRVINPLRDVDIQVDYYVIAIAVIAAGIFGAWPGVIAVGVIGLVSYLAYNVLRLCVNSAQYNAKENDISRAKREYPQLVEFYNTKADEVTEWLEMVDKELEKSQEWLKENQGPDMERWPASLQEKYKEMDAQRKEIEQMRLKIRYEKSLIVNLGETDE